MISFTVFFDFEQFFEFPFFFLLDTSTPLRQVKKKQKISASAKASAHAEGPQNAPAIILSSASWRTAG